MAQHRRGGATPSFLLPPQQGDINGGELKIAPSSLLRPPTRPARASTPGLFRRKPPLWRGAPHLPSTAQLLPEPDLCLSPGTPRLGDTARPSRRLSHLGPAHKCPIEQKSNWQLGLPSAALDPLGQLPSNCASPRGHFPLARWGFLPSGFIWMSAQPGLEGGAQPALCLPPNICILALAMMIAGIPTVPVPGVREEDMVLAAQSFMAGYLPPAGREGQAPPLRRWAAPPRLGLPCKGDKPQQRRRVAGRSLTPLFLARLER